MFKRFFAAALSAMVLLVAAAPRAVCAGQPFDAAALDTYIQSEFEKTHIPGMSVEIVSADEVLFARTYGSCESAQTPFILGSLSKSFTAVAVMQLVEQGKIDLDRPFADYIPARRAGCQTTVRQLLNQTSGIKTYATLENYKSSDTPAVYQYANVNYGLLGRIVEQVSGQRFGDYIKQHIFSPLQMTDSYASLEQAKAGGLTPGYRNYFGFLKAQEMPYPGAEIDGWLNLSSAYLISSADDMGKYLQFYLNQGGGILSADSVQTMLYDGVYVQENYQYAMGWGQYQDAQKKLLTHGGNVENYTTGMQILPELGLGVIVLFNACDYFVANAMAVQLGNNISQRLLGLATQDIKAAAFMRTHALIDAALLAVLLLSVLPLFHLGKWRAKRLRKKKSRDLATTLLLHVVLPTLLLSVFLLLGLPMAVVRDFAPDVLIVQLAAAGLLYLGGACKLAMAVRIKHAC